MRSARHCPYGVRCDSNGDGGRSHPFEVPGRFDPTPEFDDQALGGGRLKAKETVFAAGTDRSAQQETRPQRQQSIRNQTS